MRIPKIDPSDIKRIGLACLNSLLLFLSFPPASLFPLAFLSLLFLLFSLREASLKKAFFLAWTSGAVFYLLLLHWIVLNPAVEPWARPLLYLGLVLIGLFQGLYWAVPAALAASLNKIRLPVWLTFPTLLTLFDYLRSLGFLGFTWGSLGYTQVRWTAAIQPAAWGGLYILTFWVALVGGLIYWNLSFFLAAGRISFYRSLVLFSIFLLPPLCGIPLLHQTRKVEQTAPRLTVALIQGNIDQGQRWDRQYQEYNWETYKNLTLLQSPDSPDLVVWPETALPFYLRYENEFFSYLLDLTKQADVAILTGVPDVKADLISGGQQYFNSAFLFLPHQGLAGEYAKSHLVPFGERFPLKDKIPCLKDVDFGEGEWSPGSDTVLLFHPRARIGCLICFESIFPDIARRQARKGAEIFVNITNDGWFGRSGAARQHAEMAVLRAVEQGRAIARCANSGISMFITPSGRILKPTRLYVRTAVCHQLPLMNKTTFYGRHGDLFVAVLLFSFILAILWGVFKPGA